MDLSFRHDPWFRSLPRSPKDEGRVARIVVRPAAGPPGTRETPEEAEVSTDGLVGERWPVDPHSVDGGQVSLMNVHVLRACAEGDDSRTVLSGDNLQVDLDLSEENLPVGTELHVGSAVLRVSEVPHRPCGQFLERFGRLAAKRIARANRVGLRGRGVLCRVARPGRIRVGDAIRVERPPSPDPGS